MERADRETWAKRVERWKDSGLSADEFATEIGVTPKALSWWKWQLGKGEERKARRPSTRKVAVTPMTFVEMSAPARADVLEVVLLSGVRVRVPAPVDCDALARVLDVLEKR